MNTTTSPESAVLSPQSISQALVLLKALEAICDLDPGSSRQEDRYKLCEEVDNARWRIRLAKQNTDQTGAWNTSEAPKDRPIMVIGKVMAHDEYSTCAIPFSGAIEWKTVTDHSDWYWYYGHDYPQCVRSALDDEVIIHYWQEMPQERPTTKEAA